MPYPSFCPNPACSNHLTPEPEWLVRFGSYPTAAHGAVQRYRCRACGKTVSEQTESLHYFAKRRLPLEEIWQSFVGGASLREVARRYRISVMALQNGMLRLGRQAMAAQLILLSQLHPRSRIVFDGLRSFLTSQDFPCDLTTVVAREGEVILSMAHSVFRRGGTMSKAQQRRRRRKEAVWRPAKGSMIGDIYRLVSEIWDYLRPRADRPGVIDTDEHPLYHRVLSADPPAGHYRSGELFSHIRTPGSAPRTFDNPLFPVNYVDRLLRHRVKEHTRETIAFGRNATLQMHRAWIFAYDHNCTRAYRVKRPELGVHAEQSAVAPEVVDELGRSFFTRRFRLRGCAVPETIRRVWMGELPTPPVRWKAGQRGTSVRIPAFARRRVAEAYQQAC